MATDKKTAGIIAPPPIIFLALLLAGVELDVQLPAPFLNDVVQAVVGSALIITALSLVGWCVWLFRRAETPVEPYKPTLHLVESGPYGWSRNPIYLALVVAFVGAAFAIDTLWLFALIPGLVSALQWGVILREERYLNELFGDAYGAYCQKVRRWI
jgi:protein-S-isoprenylcysteine O-methyltransferase Ste14